MNHSSTWSTDDAVPPGSRRDHGPNVGGLARLASLVGGGALTAIGLRRGGALGIATGLFGGALLARGLTGRDPVKKGFGPAPYERQVAEARGWSSAAVTSQAVTINRSAADLYLFWRDFGNLPQIMANVDRIDVIDRSRSHWVVRAPGGATVEWDALVTEDVPDRRIAWESAEGADIRNAGWIEFRDAPAGRGTEVHGLIAYEPPAGQLGRLVAKLFQREPAIQMRRDLKRFKSLMETGEIAVTSRPQPVPPTA